LSIFCRSYDIRYRETIAADQIDEQRIAVVTTTERARDQVVAELYERPMDGFRREGKSVEIVQVQVSCEAEGESSTMLGSEGYDAARGIYG
jgi:hypothetical protein